MKYLPIREFADVTSALNFDTVDCHVVGGCDLYTTKAAGSDKKLYRNIEHSLESQYESLLRFSASLSPPEASTAAASLNLSRSSPFGPLSQISSRRTFAYLIATLNASHPDYDFSHLLRPTDFKRERSLRNVMNTLDTTLYNLRPRPMISAVDGPPHWSSSTATIGVPTPGGSQHWGPKMWQIIDKEMTLKECSVYCYSPDEDPYDGEEGGLWSFNYFFFNKARKRVCYIYLRGLSIISHNAVPKTPLSAKDNIDGGWETEDSGASKRARYWLGDRAAAKVTGTWGEDEEDGEIDEFPDQSWKESTFSPPPTDEALYSMSPDAAGSPRSRRGRSKSMMRAMSEDVAESMEI